MDFTRGLLSGVASAADTYSNGIKEQQQFNFNQMQDIIRMNRQKSLSDYEHQRDIKRADELAKTGREFSLADAKSRQEYDLEKIRAGKGFTDKEKWDIAHTESAAGGTYPGYIATSKRDDKLMAEIEQDASTAIAKKHLTIDGDYKDSILLGAKELSEATGRPTTPDQFYRSLVQEEFLNKAVTAGLLTKQGSSVNWDAIDNMIGNADSLSEIKRVGDKLLQDIVSTYGKNSEEASAMLDIISDAKDAEERRQTQGGDLGDPDLPSGGGSSYQPGSYGVTPIKDLEFPEINPFEYIGKGAGVLGQAAGGLLGNIADYARGK